MDDFEEYRKKHREAYQKRRGNAHPPSSASFGTTAPVGAQNGSEWNEHSMDVHRDHSSSLRSDHSSLRSKDLRSESPFILPPERPSVACSSSSSMDTIQSTLHTNSPSLDPQLGDPDYESSIELARKLQEEFDRHARGDVPSEGVRRPDETYTECLLPNVPQGGQFDQSDVDLQRAIAKSLIDM